MYDHNQGDCMIYLDYTAHMPACRQAIGAFLEAEANCLGNANAHHGAGFAANQRLTDARDKIARMLRVRSEEIIFTSGASESNNTAVALTEFRYRALFITAVSIVIFIASAGGYLLALRIKNTLAFNFRS